ncbi:MAG: UDP-N-acetylglucosamine--N-acetylmuramyl-(pentapeptide) pyrophosphoryl-undecaprenol N-acetylglucosamine transferase, partial [Candidatus Omnitrophota bacterium]
MKILVASGASGGHIFPAMSLLDNLKNDPRAETLLVIPYSSKRNNIETAGYNTVFVSIENIRLSSVWRILISIFNFLKGSLQSLIILIGFRPDEVVCFGSISSVPILLWAWLFRIRTMIHEQNVVPGKANRFLAGFADKVAVSFSQSAVRFKSNKDKCVVTGNPLRNNMVLVERSKALYFFGFNSQKFTVSAMGGSQGSSRINEDFSKAVSITNYRHRLQAVHLCGQNDFDVLRKRYTEVGSGVKLFKFLNSMSYLYSASDLVVCRAGATTISELIYFRVPAIIIPYPYAYRHQFNNALILQKAGAAVIVEENELSADLLRQMIEDCINDPERMAKM